jgi:hypothetical protein
MSLSLDHGLQKAKLNEPENRKIAKRDPVNHPRRSEKSFIGQMRETFFTPFAQRGLLDGPEMKTARFKQPLRTEPDASCNPRATGRSGCTPAEPYPPSANASCKTTTQNSM